jgi:protein-S-isoprenylcysteine O-methyltransferase Ste14
MMYYTLHSALAANGIKALFRHWLPHVYPYYRALYSFLAAVNFALLAWLHLSTPSAVIADFPSWVSIPAWGCIAAGVYITWLSVKGYGIDFFIRESATDHHTRPLVVRGPNRYVRHPLYSALLLMLVGVVLLSPQWKNVIFFAITFLYSIIGALIEEQKLLSLYGGAYADYRSRVRMLIPYLL